MRYDVIIIGSGVAGSTVAEEVLARGASSVAMVECGPKPLMRDSRTWHDVAMAGRPTWDFDRDMMPYTIPAVLQVPQMDRLRYRREDIDESGNMRFDLPSRALRAQGGSTLIWDGWSLRLKPEDFRLRSHTGAGADWPISYDELEPFYALAELSQQVAGEASDEGHPPRSGAYPLPPFPYQRSDEPFLGAMDALGWSSQHIPLSRNTEHVRGMPQCKNTGTCAYCPIGGRFTGDQPLERLARLRQFTLYGETTARRLLMGNKETVRAVEVVNRSTGDTEEIEAGHFVLCGGAIESPKLLLASACDHWPQGLGNDHDLVGRFLTNHPLLTVHPRPELSVTEGHVPAELDFPTVCSRQLDSSHDQRRGGKVSIIYLSFGADLRWHLLQGKSVAQVGTELERGWPLGMLMVTTEQVPHRDNRVRLGEGLDPFLLPRTRIDYSLEETERQIQRRLAPTCRAIYRAMGYEGRLRAGLALTAHQMGTCRMARRPEEGVVDRNLKLFGVGNLSLCGSAVFASGAAVNPTLTIGALAHRLGRHLCE